ncbi:uncharacterized protein BDZ99DRAFT_559138 [Mytilinidion resinicola]|uniref:Uncharacterized protein n=1 Tax=Mytilinidion resinicola TaxID=574789 RepID=A0A6A6YXP0_9PEZI|nr:uncharacterized protein BDZ99DRAFT_559138 [Mytilinidion resinicola]KAF2812764.1 hypothetical protein BDZ99DRAFT_559138 [Mytilinidion resinicola]
MRKSDRCSHELAGGTTSEGLHHGAGRLKWRSAKFWFIGAMPDWECDMSHSQSGIARIAAAQQHTFPCYSTYRINALMMGIGHRLFDFKGDDAQYTDYLEQHLVTLLRYFFGFPYQLRQSVIPPHQPTSLPHQCISLPPPHHQPTSLPYQLRSPPHQPNSLPHQPPPPHQPTSLPYQPPPPHQPTSLPYQPHSPSHQPQLQSPSNATWFQYTPPTKQPKRDHEDQRGRKTRRETELDIFIKEIANWQAKWERLGFDSFAPNLVIATLVNGCREASLTFLVTRHDGDTRPTVSTASTGGPPDDEKELTLRRLEGYVDATSWVGENGELHTQFGRCTDLILATVGRVLEFYNFPKDRIDSVMTKRFGKHKSDYFYRLRLGAGWAVRNATDLMETGGWDNDIWEALLIRPWTSFLCKITPKSIQIPVQEIEETASREHEGPHAEDSDVDAPTPNQQQNGIAPPNSPPRGNCSGVTESAAPAGGSPIMHRNGNTRNEDDQPSRSQPYATPLNREIGDMSHGDVPQQGKAHVPNAMPQFEIESCQKGHKENPRLAGQITLHNQSLRRQQPANSNSTQQTLQMLPNDLGSAIIGQDGLNADVHGPQSSSAYGADGMRQCAQADVGGQICLTGQAVGDTIPFAFQQTGGQISADVPYTQTAHEQGQLASFGPPQQTLPVRQDNLPMDLFDSHGCLPMDLFNSHGCLPMDLFDSHGCQPMDLFDSHGCQPMDYSDSRGCLPMDYVDSHGCQPMDYSDSRGSLPMDYSDSRGCL